jgi:hypothetical protein
MDYKEKVYCQPNIFMDWYSGGLGAINRRQQDQHHKIEQNLGKKAELHFGTFLLKVVVETYLRASLKTSVFRDAL